MEKYSSKYNVNKLLLKNIKVDNFRDIIKRELIEGIVREIVKNKSILIKEEENEIDFNDIIYSIDIFLMGKDEFRELYNHIESIKQYIPIEKYKEIIKLL